MIRVTGLWKKTDKNGKDYFEGSFNDHAFNQIVNSGITDGKIYIFHYDSPNINAPEYVIYISDRPLNRGE